MSEKTMRKRIVKALKDLDALPVENPICPGTPDVNFCGGWLELKWLKGWPKGADIRPVRVRHFTKQQRIWLARRAKVCDGVFLLFQVGKEWFLFRGDWAAEHFGNVTRSEMVVGAHAYWPTGLKNKELVKCLS